MSTMREDYYYDDEEEELRPLSSLSIAPPSSKDGFQSVLDNLFSNGWHLCDPFAKKRGVDKNRGLIVDCNHSDTASLDAHETITAGGSFSSKSAPSIVGDKNKAGARVVPRSITTTASSSSSVKAEAALVSKEPQVQVVPETQKKNKKKNCKAMEETEPLQPKESCKKRQAGAVFLFLLLLILGIYSSFSDIQFQKKQKLQREQLMIPQEQQMLPEQELNLVPVREQQQILPEQGLTLVPVQNKWLKPFQVGFGNSKKRISPQERNRTRRSRRIGHVFKPIVAQVQDRTKALVQAWNKNWKDKVMLGKQMS